MHFEMHVEYIILVTNLLPCVPVQSLLCSSAPLLQNFGLVVKNKNSNNISDSRDVKLHAILCFVPNLGLRYDEASKLSMKHFWKDFGKFTLTINQKIEFSTGQRIYETRDRLRNFVIQSLLFTDPSVALHLWVKMRGATDGLIIVTSRDFKQDFTSIKV